jgi:chemotaxis-related protein WspB
VLLLLFRLENDRYALDASQVVEVLPLLSVKKIPQASPGVAGVMNYRGQPVPVIDLCELALGKPANLRLSTRIILVKYPTGEEGGDHVLGLIAEQATETLKRELDNFVSSGVDIDEAPYLGPVITDSRGLIQLIEVPKLLPTRVRDQLFSRPLEKTE